MDDGACPACGAMLHYSAGIPPMASCPRCHALYEIVGDGRGELRRIERPSALSVPGRTRARIGRWIVAVLVLSLAALALRLAMR